MRQLTKSAKLQKKNTCRQKANHVGSINAHFKLNPLVGGTHFNGLKHRCKSTKRHFLDRKLIMIADLFNRGTTASKIELTLSLGGRGGGEGWQSPLAKPQQLKRFNLQETTTKLRDFFFIWEQLGMTCSHSSNLILQWQPYFVIK